MRGQAECLPSPSTVISNNSTELPRVETAKLIRKWRSETALSENDHGSPERIRSTWFVDLQTIPMFLENRSRQIEVNALLDDVNTMTYLNSDVAGQLSPQGHCQIVTGNLVNGRIETFGTMPVELEVGGVD